MQGKHETFPGFAVTLRPNRSLSRQGVRALIAVLAGLSMAVGLIFWSIGAWPIAGFLGADVALVWWALRRSWLAAECLEQISITGDEVTLFRKPWRGASSLRIFDRRWLRVELEFDELRELAGRLFLSYRGGRHEIGSFLGEDDRQSLARALRRAIAG